MILTRSWARGYKLVEGANRDRANMANIFFFIFKNVYVFF